MNPEILERKRFTVMGLTMRVASDCTDSGPFENIWREFETHHTEVMPHSTDEAYYGVRFPPSEDGASDYIAGIAVCDDVTPISAMVIREVPAARYAVFATPVEEIGPTYQFAFAHWFPSSEYELSSAAPVFEQYPPANASSAPVLIHIPVNKREG